MRTRLVKAEGLFLMPRSGDVKEVFLQMKDHV